MHAIQDTHFKRIRIKFCGITQLADAQYADRLGVDALGFVFYEKSPRYIVNRDAATICNQLSPFITKVGLFVNADIERIKATLEIVQLDILQFHGDESENFCQQFQKPYIKAIQVKTSEDIFLAMKKFPSAKAILLDSFHVEKHGGIGEVFDWSMIPNNFSKPIILAGGLNPGNVKKAIKAVQPYAVDVSSGIEMTKGKKDFQKMKEFVEEVYNENKL